MKRNPYYKNMCPTPPMPRPNLLLLNLSPHLSLFLRGNRCIWIARTTHFSSRGNRHLREITFLTSASMAVLRGSEVHRQQHHQNQIKTILAKIRLMLRLVHHHLCAGSKTHLRLQIARCKKVNFHNCSSARLKEAVLMLEEACHFK